MRAALIALAALAWAALAMACEPVEAISATPASLEAPACDGCAFGHSVCIEGARAETLAEIADDACEVPVCILWYRQRAEACDESYIRCTKTCGR